MIQVTIRGKEMLNSKRTPILTPPRADKEYEIKVYSEICDGCELCVEFCPCDVLEIDMDSYNSRMLHFVKVNALEKCTGCNQCERICPTVSIMVIERDIPQVKD
jgi:2-oxoglutarate ferredoxin oxidoreductase subunit delta